MTLKLLRSNPDSGARARENHFASDHLGELGVFVELDFCICGTGALRSEEQ